MVRFKKEDAISSLLAEAAGSLPAATEAFADTVRAEPGQREEHIARVRALEERADQYFETILRSVTATFITPFDREDIYRFAESLDDGVDAVEHACQLLDTYDIGEVPPSFIEQAEDLQYMAEEAAAIVVEIKRGDELVVRWRNAHALEKAINVRHREICADLLSGEHESFEALRLKEFAEAIEAAGDRIEDFVRVMAHMAIKET